MLTASPPPSLTLPLLVDTNELAQYLGHEALVVVDLTNPRVYKQAHVPSAVWLDPKRLLRADEDAQGVLPSNDTLTALFAEIGVTPQTHVVVYDDEGGGWAGRFIWTLDRIGHSHYSLLDGGIHAWLASGEDVESGVIEPKMVKPMHLDQSLHTHPEAIADEILQIIVDQSPVKLWDCRSMEEYTGERLLARRGGHIPSAIHYEWTNVMDKGNALRLRSLEQIKFELKQCGIIVDGVIDHQFQPIIVYCQSHHRSGLAYVVGKLLGLDIRAYAGAWSEWGNSLNLPIHSSKI